MITMTETGEMNYPVEGKLRYCRCKIHCSKARTYKCGKMNKFCNEHQHGGKGYHAKKFICE